MRLTSKTLLLAFREFLEVWINQILYYNEIYDSLIFDKFKAFNLVVYKNRHPKLQEYIHELFSNFIRNVLLHGSDTKKRGKSLSVSGVNQIVCVVYNEKIGKVHRKYIINFNELIVNLGDTVSIDDLLNDDKDQIELNDKSAAIKLDGINWEEIYTQFNTILFQHIQELRRFQNAKASDILAGNELFFKILVELEESVNVVNANWVRVNDKVVEKKATSRAPKYISIGDINLQLLNFDVHNEYYI
ncbi:DNA-binding protein [Scheffersomyces xylosifermentans]|uniref:DNA-binding protein n=1 Tax=Scheffersomyces xylosifermentans TaxID=1304137 RepID=UPI00315CAC8E